MNDTIITMIQIDTTSTVSLAEQIEAEIRRAIASRVVQRGDNLPPVRQLAADLGVNLNTVARAYRALEASGLIITRRGRGTIVTANCENSTDLPPSESVVAVIAKELEKIISDAKLSGMKKKDIFYIFDQLAGKYW